MRRLVIYKLELICVKYVPIIIALLSLLDNVLMYYDISLDILSYIAGTSILTTIPMYISSYVYKFCKYHRIYEDNLFLYNPFKYNNLEGFFVYLSINRFHNILFIPLYHVSLQE